MKQIVPDSLCPKCRQASKRPIPDAKAPEAAGARVKEYVIERQYKIRRINGEFV